MVENRKGLLNGANQIVKPDSQLNASLVLMHLECWGQATAVGILRLARFAKKN